MNQNRRKFWECEFFFHYWYLCFELYTVLKIILMYEFCLSWFCARLDLCSDQYLFYVIRPSNIRIKTILNTVLWSTRQLFSNLRPMTTHWCIQRYQLKILFFCPVLLLYFRIQLVYVPFSYLFPCFSTNNLRKYFPVLSKFFN